MSTSNIWYVYIIRTDDGQLYTGITTDMQRRWREHRTGKGGARYFRARKPKAVVWLELHPDRSSASKREAAIKNFSKMEKENLIAQTQFADELFILLNQLNAVQSL